LVLGQVKVENHSNEITAIPALLELIDVTGAIITMDAMGTQTEIVRLIRQKKADYVVTLKRIIQLFTNKSRPGLKQPEPTNLPELK
jgi:predicted transposase YbfD/YdcC